MFNENFKVDIDISISNLKFLSTHLNNLKNDPDK